jgi:hypothetical protein
MFGLDGWVLMVIAVVGIIASMIAHSAKLKADAEENKRKHVERLKALELGQPLSDVEIAKAQAENSRAWAAGTVGLLVVPGVLIVALIATVTLLSWQSYMLGSESPSFDLRNVPPILYAIWGICGLVSMITAIMSMTAVAVGKPRRNDKVPGRRTSEELAEVLPAEERR